VRPCTLLLLAALVALTAAWRVQYHRPLRALSGAQENAAAGRLAEGAAPAGGQEAGPRNRGREL
jgi:hypothetical protein